MASFQIPFNSRTNSNVALNKKKEVGAFTKRAVLGEVNPNKIVPRNSKPSLQVDKGAKLQNLRASSQENVSSASCAGQKPKAGGVFKVFEDENRVQEPNVAIKNKSRVLRDRKIENVASTAVHHEPVLPVCISDLHRPLSLPVPEPMSPDDSLNGSMSMDVSMKSDTKAKECETALKELDYLNLTERMYMCEEYRDEITLYLRTLQEAHKPRSNYMTKQPDITHNMRAVLVDWLVEVVEEYKLSNETLYLTVSYIDRFLSCMSVVRAKLQLVGTAAMFIAAKYEEIYPPDVKDFVYITDDTYTKSQVLRMEHLILRVLKFDLATPSILNFLTDYTSHYPTPDNVKYLAMYLSELSLLEGDPYLQFLPSEIAAGALCLARATLLPEEEILPSGLQKVLDVHLGDIVKVIIALESTYRNAERCQQQATRDKYKSEKYSKVATIEPQKMDCCERIASFSPTSSL